MNGDVINNRKIVITKE